MIIFFKKLFFLKFLINGLFTEIVYLFIYILFIKKISVINIFMLF